MPANKPSSPNISPASTPSISSASIPAVCATRLAHALTAMNSNATAVPTFTLFTSAIALSSIWHSFIVATCSFSSSRIAQKVSWRVRTRGRRDDRGRAYALAMRGAGSVLNFSLFSSANCAYVSTACASMSSLKLYASAGDINHKAMRTR
eukprot:31423-Pelagococcus_subviridis.AAC.2